MAYAVWYSMVWYEMVQSGREHHFRNVLRRQETTVIATVLLQCLLLSNAAIAPSTTCRYERPLQRLIDIEVKRSAAYGLWTFSGNTIYNITQVRRAGCK